MSSKDLMMLDHLDDMREAGIDSIKIEGRAKGAYYVATIVNAYRHVLDGANPADFMGELDAVSHRPYHTGFFYGKPDQTDANVEYAQDKILVGFVEGFADDGRAWTTLRNRASSGQVVEVLSPGKPVRSFMLGYAYDLDTEETARVANRSGDRYAFAIPFEVSVGDVLRRNCEPGERRG